LSVRLVEDQRRGEGLCRSAERQRQIARLEEQVSHGIITPERPRPWGVLTGVGLSHPARTAPAGL
jgi:hypothetical protein